MPINFELWPPTREDAERRAKYAYYEEIFDGDFLTAFAHKSADLDPGETYLGADWGSLICKVNADMLFGQPPIVSVGDDQRQLDQLLKNCDLFALLNEAALPQAFRGDAVLLLEWSSEKQTPVVTEIPACNYFCLRSRDNDRKILEEALAWEVHIGIDTYLRVDRYKKGQITRECYLVGNPVGTPWEVEDCGIVKFKKTTKVDLSAAYPDPDDEPVPPEKGTYSLPNGRSPIFPIPNQRHGSRFFGISELAGGLPSLIDAFNQRLTELHEVLSKHSDPKLLLPEGVLDKNGRIRSEDLGVIEIPNESENGDVFKYLIWDGQLIPATGELKILEELIFKFSETSPAIFGSDKAGSIESGRAMKFRFQRTLAKIARKVRIWDPILKELIYLIHWLAAENAMEITFPDGAKEKVKPPTRYAELAWQNGLPQDTKEQIEIESQRVLSGLTSRVKAIQRLDQSSEQKAEDELETIAEENKKYGPPGNGTAPQNGSPEDGGQGPAAPAPTDPRRPVIGGGAGKAPQGAGPS
ncbi:MAG: phage portal protein [Candidatus Eremiobacteraeota bacterium]|nr:phage portal protein [Candidatus Eremiobacteraeota bacterium]